MHVKKVPGVGMTDRQLERVAHANTLAQTSILLILTECIAVGLAEPFNTNAIAALRIIGEELEANKANIMDAQQD